MQQEQLIREYSAACLSGVWLNHFCDFVGYYSPLTLWGTAQSGVPTTGYPLYGLVDRQHCIVICGARIVGDEYGRGYYTLFYYDPYYDKCLSVSGFELPSWIFIYVR